MPGMAFSVAVLPRAHAEESFRANVQNLQLHEHDDCCLTVFHVEDSYALINGEAVPGADAATNSALSAYLTRCLRAKDLGLDLEVKADEVTMPAGSSGKESVTPTICPLYPFI